MTQNEVIKFIESHNQPGPITWGEYKRLLILENLLLAKVTNIPVDVESLEIYTKLSEKDLKTVLDNMITEGIIKETTHHLIEGTILTLNVTEEKNAGSLTS